MSDRSMGETPSSVVSLSARDVCESAVDDLKPMLVEARELARRLAWRMTEARRREQAPAAAITELDERLILGARMLKAFEVQIGRAEATIVDLDRFVAGRLGEMTREVERVDGRVAAVGDQVADLSQVVETAEVACAAMSPRVAQLAATVQARLLECEAAEARLMSLLERVERADDGEERTADIVTTPDRLRFKRA